MTDQSAREGHEFCFGTMLASGGNWADWAIGLFVRIYEAVRLRVPQVSTGDFPALTSQTALR